jgi:RNA polymerase sigma-70 factor (ECF subfamily)
MTIATRVGISELRRKHCKDISLDGITAGDSLKIELAVVDDENVGTDMDRRSIIEKLQLLIDDVLSDKQRLAIRGLLEGLPIEEIASRTGSNRNAVYKLVHDARSKLKEGFKKSGILAEDVTAIFA